MCVSTTTPTVCVHPPPYRHMINCSAYFIHFMRNGFVSVILVILQMSLRVTLVRGYHTHTCPLGHVCTVIFASQKKARKGCTHLLYSCFLLSTLVHPSLLLSSLRLSFLLLSSHHLSFFICPFFSSPFISSHLLSCPPFQLSILLSSPLLSLSLFSSPWLWVTCGNLQYILNIPISLSISGCQSNPGICFSEMLSHSQY